MPELQPRSLLLGLLVGLGSLAALGGLTRLVAEQQLGGSARPALDATQEPDPALYAGALDQLVDATLTDAVLLDELHEPREDALYSWDQVSRIYQLPAGDDPRSLAQGLERQAEERGMEAYVTTPNELDVDLRVYAGKRLLEHIQLIPTLDRPPTSRGLERPLVALVVAGLGREGLAGDRVIKAPVPLTVAIEPFTPFALLHSRAATLEHKEVMVDLPVGVPLDKALAAVPFSTGLLFGEPRPLDMRLLQKEHFYLLDGTGQVEAAALRQARNVGIPVLEVAEDLHGDIEGRSVRIAHLAARHGAVVLLSSLEDRDATRSAIRWLYGNQATIRPVFVSEILDWQRIEKP